MFVWSHSHEVSHPLRTVSATDRGDWVSTVFLSDLKTSHEHNMPILIETMTRHRRGTVRDVNEHADFIVIQTPKAMADTISMTTLAMAEIVSVKLNG